MASQFLTKRILVVDDNRDAADLTAQLLEMHGHMTTVAYGGQQGICSALSSSPDVVLLDLGMPGTDGYAVATVLRQSPTLDGSVLIAYTAWSDEETRRRVRACGFDQHLAKPARLATLLTLVSETRRTDGPKGSSLGKG